MKLLIALALLALSLNALAVDITLTITGPMMNRAQSALGEARNLKTPDTPAVITNGVEVTPMVPGVSRNATVGEVKQYLSDTLRILVHSRENEKEGKRAAATAVQPAAFDPQ